MTRPANELMPSSLREADGPVFHYTSPAGLLGIVESGCLWASEASSLNDLAEVRHGWEVVRSWLDARKATSDAADRLFDLAENPLEEEHEVFVLSGSTAADDANQWRLYAAAGSGYAVEINPGIDLVAVTEEPEPSEPDEPNIFASLHFGEVVAVTPWYHVLYDETNAEVALAELETAYADGLARAAKTATSRDEYEETRQELQGSAYAALGTVAHLIKAPGFRGEQEVRVVTTYLFADHHIRYRPGPHGVVGYGLLTTAPHGHRVTRVGRRSRGRAEHQPNRLPDVAGGGRPSAEA